MNTQPVKKTSTVRRMRTTTRIDRDLTDPTPNLNKAAEFAKSGGRLRYG